MTIECKICQRAFKKQITNSHLKTHGLTTHEYKELHGSKSLSSNDYRLEKSNNMRGDKNPNYGNRWDDALKAQVSSNIKSANRSSWNKGLTIDDYPDYYKNSIRMGIKNRESRYKSGDLARCITNLSDESKEKISKSIKKYAELNPNEMKRRAADSVKTKVNNGYYTKKREMVISNDINMFKEYDFEAEHIANRIYSLKCNKCHAKFTRGSMQWSHNMCPSCGRCNSISKGEKEVYEYVSNLLSDCDVMQSDWETLKPFELDIHIKSQQIAIEFNGLYWHSDSAGKSKWYHRTKMKKCNELGIQLIQIFEDEWEHKQDIVRARLEAKLTNTNKIYGRNTIVKRIDKEIAFRFIEQHHIQGKGQGLYFFGLFHDNDLISVMSFSKLNRAKGLRHIGGVYELNRFCSSKTIVGGASKLFRHFIQTVDPDVVLTYSDLRWNTGDVYEKMGFSHVGDTTPGYWYTLGTKRLHRYSLRKTETDPINVTEYELRKSQGYHRIWDCGHAKYIWKKGD